MWPCLNLPGKTRGITKYMKFQRFFGLFSSVPVLCFHCAGTPAQLALLWSEGSGSNFVCNVCVGILSIPHGQGLPDRAESRVAQFSEDRDRLGRGGDCFWNAGDAREKPSVAQLHLLLLISSFHIPQSFGCCLLFFLSGPSSRLFRHWRCPSLGVWGCSSPSIWERGVFHPLWLGMGTCSSTRDWHSILSPGEQSRCLCILVCMGRGDHSQTCRAVWQCLLHDSGPEKCSSTCISGFPPSSSVSSHLWKLWVPHVSGALLWDPVQVPLKPVECFASMEAFSIDSRRGESGIRVAEPVQGELVGASEK